MIRAFIAIDLSDEVHAAIGEAQARLKRARLGVKVSWTKIENLHLTLQFLGCVPEPLVEQISAALTDVAEKHAAFNCPVRGAGAFPDEEKPRVLWVGVGSEVVPLARAVQQAMRPLGFEPHDREFTGHLTLGRVKQPRPDATLTTALDCLKIEAFGTLRVDAVHLFQSQLHPEGSIYTKLSSHQLGDTHHAGKS